MFYIEDAERMDKALRFGDVLKGFASCSSVIHNPPLSEHLKYQIEIEKPPFCVILSPCCSIRDNILSLAPFVEIKNSLFGNEHFVKDPTLINVKIEAIYSVPAKVLETMEPEEKANLLIKGRSYVFSEYFIYKEHDLFPPYEVPRRTGKIPCRHYMIDFRAAFKVDCKRIISPERSPLECKCLQLKDEIRAQLRDKISYYYARIPTEEMAALS